MTPVIKLASRKGRDGESGCIALPCDTDEDPEGEVYSLELHKELHDDKGIFRQSFIVIQAGVRVGILEVLYNTNTSSKLPITENFRPFEGVQVVLEGNVNVGADIAHPAAYQEQQLLEA